MTGPVSRTEDELRRLRVENRALDEQVRLLTRTEQELYRYRRAVGRQIAQLEGVLGVSARYGGDALPEEIVQALASLLFEHFALHQLAVVSWDPSRAPRLLDDPCCGLRDDARALLESAVAQCPTTTRWLYTEPGPMAPDVASALRLLDLLSPDGEQRSEPGDVFGGFLIPAPDVGGTWEVMFRSRKARRRSYFLATPGEEHDPFFRLLIDQGTRLIGTSVRARVLQRQGRALRASNEALSKSLATQRATQQQLLRSAKLEAIGRLAGGVAHDFNNLLTLIVGYTSQARQRASHDPQLAADLDEVIGAGQRAADLTKQLLTFGREQDLDAPTVELNRVVEGMREMLTRLCTEDIQLEVQVNPEAVHVRMDPVHIEQIILNLVVNARDALQRGGSIAVEVDRYERGLPAQEHADRRVAGIIRVVDDGTGMEEAVQDRMFEPFFTTKDVGEGTGMGLSIVYGIVRQGGGSIDVVTAPGAGTTVEVALPIAAADEVNERNPILAPLCAMDHRGLIFLVEDEERIRTLCESVLRAAGYTVRSFARGQAFLDAVAEARPDLLLLDVVMPEFGGPELARAAGDHCAGAAVIYISGHTRSKLSAHDLEADAATFLRKPFTPDELIRAVAQAVRENATPTNA